MHKKLKLDTEEKKLLASLERGEWKPISKIKEIEIRKHVQQAAINYLRKTKKKSINST